MYLNISHYAGMADKIGEGAAKTQQGLVPLLRSQPGFLGYAAFASEQGDGISLHIWENADALNQSRDKIRTWVQANSAAFLDPTKRFHGEVTHHALTAPQSGGLEAVALLHDQAIGQRPHWCGGAHAVGRPDRRRAEGFWISRHLLPTPPGRQEPRGLSPLLRQQ